MDNLPIITDLKERIENIEERLLTIELEQRKIIEDIISGQAMERMRQRILDKPKEKTIEKNKMIENSKIEI